MTNISIFISKLQVAAILLMTAGWGWNGGNFTPADAPFINPLLHTIPVLLLLVMSLQILRVRGTQERFESNANWATVAVSVFAVVSIIGCIVMIVLGATNPDPNSVGVHSLEDWFPVVILNMGTFLWLATLFLARYRVAEVRTANNN